MPKRKRETDEDIAAEPSRSGAKQQRVAFKLDQGTKKLAHAFKIAKGFERQKLGRRQKAATSQNDGKEIERIEAEIAALKTLDTAAAAAHFLYKSLVKIKAVAESEVLHEILKDVPLGADTARLNVNARLCNSNPVKVALPDILVDVQRAAGIDVRSQDAKKKKRVRAKDFEEAQGSTTKTAALGKVPLKDVVFGERLEEEPHLSGSDDNASHDEFASFGDRLASTDDEDQVDLENGQKGIDSDDEFSDVAGLERQLQSEGHELRPARNSHPFAEDDMSSDEEDVFSDSDQEARTSSKSARSTLPKHSTLIPSLSLGGYISGSEGSDIEDIDVAPRKNRPGQRARQAIWEKKYGSGAKHLQNPKNDRDKGWDAKKGATDRGSVRGGRGGFQRSRAGQSSNQRPSGQRAESSSKPTKRDDAGPIHPSWEAAKRAKERNAGVPAFTGKKISFD